MGNSIKPGAAAEAVAELPLDVELLDLHLALSSAEATACSLRAPPPCEYVRRTGGRAEHRACQVDLGIVG